MWCHGRVSVWGGRFCLGAAWALLLVARCCFPPSLPVCSTCCVLRGAAVGLYSRRWRRSSSPGARSIAVAVLPLPGALLPRGGVGYRPGVCKVWLGSEGGTCPYERCVVAHAVGVKSCAAFADRMADMCCCAVGSCACSLAVLLYLTSPRCPRWSCV